MAKKETSLALLLLKPVIFLLLPFFIILNIMPGPNGQPMFNWAQDAKHWLTSLKATSIVSQPMRVIEPESVELYRWQDDKGVWHFSENKPQNQSDVQTITVSTKLQNVMPKPEELPTPAASEGQASEAVTPLNVLQKAKDLHKTAEKRNQVLDSL